MAAYLTLLAPAPDDPRIATFNVEELQDKQMTWVKGGSFWEVVEKRWKIFGGQKMTKNIEVNSQTPKLVQPLMLLGRDDIYRLNGIKHFLKGMTNQEPSYGGCSGCLES